MVTRFALVAHPSLRPSPRSCLTGRGRRTRFSLRRFLHEHSQRLIVISGHRAVDTPLESRITNGVSFLLFPISRPLLPDHP